MSIFAEITERRALKRLANTLRYFGEMSDLKMTAIDAQEVKSAKNAIRRVIESNGYTVRCNRGSKTELININNE